MEANRDAFVEVGGSEVGSAIVKAQEETMSPQIETAPILQQEAVKRPFFKQKKFWLVSSIILTVLALIITLSLIVRYQTGKIQGYWRSPKLEKELVKEIETNLSGVESDIGIELDKVLKSETVALDINDGEVTMMVSYVFDKEAFYTAHQESLTNSEYSAYLGDDYSDLLQDFMPSRNEVDSMVDEMLEQTGKEEGFDYDRETGQLEAIIFEGIIHRISRTIEITEIDNDVLELDNIDIDEGDRIEYQKSISDLILKVKKAKDDVIFKKGQINSSTTY